jgi:hypothetical protein
MGFVTFRLFCNNATEKKDGAIKKQRLHQQGSLFVLLYVFCCNCAV